MFRNKIGFIGKVRKERERKKILFRESVTI